MTGAVRYLRPRRDDPNKGRNLRCVRCSTLVQVYEIPEPFIDPRLFVCGVCLEAGAGQLQLDQPQRRPDETRSYDPAIARIPYAVYKRQGWGAWRGGRWSC